MPAACYQSITARLRKYYQRYLYNNKGPCFKQGPLLNYY